MINLCWLRLIKEDTVSAYKFGLALLRKLSTWLSNFKWLSMVTPRNFSLLLLVILKFDTWAIGFSSVLSRRWYLSALAFIPLLLNHWKRSYAFFLNVLEHHQNYHKCSKECYRYDRMQYLCLLLLEKDHSWKYWKYPNIEPWEIPKSNFSIEL